MKKRKQLKQLNVGDLILIKHDTIKQEIMYVVTDKAEYRKDYFYGYDAVSLEGYTINLDQHLDFGVSKNNYFKREIKNLTPE